MEKHRNTTRIDLAILHLIILNELWKFIQNITLTWMKKNSWDYVPGFSFCAYRGVPVILVKVLDDRCPEAWQIQ